MLVTGYKEGQPFELDVEPVEGSQFLAKLAVPSAQAMLADARSRGIRVGITSSFRAMIRQRYLYDGWTAHLPGFHPADRPGFSKHQLGDCLDLEFGTEAERERFATEVAPKYGWKRTVPREPWHFQFCSETRPDTAGTGGPAGGAPQ